VRELDVVLVGPVAPPRGGVSAHVERLATLLEDDGLRVGILNHFSGAVDTRIIASLRRNPVRYWLRLRHAQAPVIHYHHARLSTLLAAALARKSSRSTWIVTFHSHVIERSLTSKVPGVAFATRWATKRFDRIVAVSEALGNIVRTQTGSSVTIIPAYLPLSDNRNGDRDTESIAPTAIVAAYRVASRASEDLYGLDLASAIFAAASKTTADLRFEMFLAQPPASAGARRYLAQVLAPLKEAGLETQFKVNVGSELSPSLRRGAVYLRTTRTDGDAVSIREALDAGVPVLASDVAKRPAETIQLPLDDVPAWVTALCAAIERSQSSPITARRSNEQAEALKLLYREEIRRWSGP
jgi:glycosyltransferase involved in cell wall biosynthesis